MEGVKCAVGEGGRDGEGVGRTHRSFYTFMNVG